MTPRVNLAAKDVFPVGSQRPAVVKWTKFRVACVKRSEAANSMPAGATDLWAAFMQKERAILKETGHRVGELIVAPYQQRLTCGEVAKRRYEITRAASESERQFREATTLADHERQMQAQQLAQRQYQEEFDRYEVPAPAANMARVTPASPDAGCHGVGSGEWSGLLEDIYLGAA